MLYLGIMFKHFLFLFLIAIMLTGFLPGAVPSVESREIVYQSTITGAFNPVLVDYLNRSIETASTQQASYLLLIIDTPGGLETSMREMVQAILRSPVPVITYVSPSGARAASAGSFLVLSSHHAFMSPGTTIGAAAPITLEGETAGDKVISDAASFMRTLATLRHRNPETAETMVTESASFTAREALNQNLIDGTPFSLEELWTMMGLSEPLVVDLEMTSRESFFHTLLNPSLAYILLILGGIGLFLELSNPGSIVPGVFGGLSLILAFYAFSILPVSGAGIIFILLGLLLLALDLFVTPGIGVLTAGGGISLFLGSFLLFENVSGFQLPTELIVITVGTLLCFFVFALGMAIRAQRRRIQTGIESLTGKTGRAQTDLAPRGFIMLDGELWTAESEQPVEKDEEVVILKKEGPVLWVKKREVR